MTDIYKAPESDVSNLLAKEPVYDIAGIRRYRWLMLLSLAVWYFCDKLFTLGLSTYKQHVLVVWLVGILANIAFFAILASKIYHKTWITVLCIVLSLIPLVNIIACIFMNIRAKEVMRYGG